MQVAVENIYSYATERDHDRTLPFYRVYRIPQT